MIFESEVKNTTQADIETCCGATFPKLKYGNCHIFCIIFKILNWGKSEYKLKFITVRGVWVLSSHIIYDSKYRIMFRSRPKGNMTRLFFKGRPQVIPINRF